MFHAKPSQSNTFVFQCCYDSSKDTPFYVDTESFLNGQTEYLCSDGKTHRLTLEEKQIILREYKKAVKEKIETFENTLTEQTPSLFGIVYNWKGQKEENYLMTGEELMEYDDGLYQDVMLSPDRCGEGASCGWKTWTCYRLDTPEEVKGFLTGSHNCFPSELSPDNYSGLHNPFQVIDDLESWYWETPTDGRDFGTKDTVKMAIEILQIPEEELTGYEKAPNWVEELCKVREIIQDAFNTYGENPWHFCLKTIDGAPTWYLEAERETEPPIEVKIISKPDAEYFDVDLEAIALYYEVPIYSISNALNMQK